ncbi:MAG: nucleoid-associated protein YgaU [Myxococcota bacterium]|jgi:nucleoid-associated protein YgaU
MGLFDFARNIGKKIGLTDDEPDPKDDKAIKLANQRRSITLTGEIKKLGLDIKNLKVAFAAGKAVIEGQAGSAQMVHKAVVALGNIEGVNQVNSRLTVLPPRRTATEAAPVAVEPPPPVLYTVKSGDSLSLISKALYGPIHLYPAIFEANQPMITDIDQIYPGQVLTIPEDPTPLVHTVKSGETLGKIARYHYGDSKLYTTIFEANKNILSNPNAIDVGQNLTIPLLRKPGANA